MMRSRIILAVAIFTLSIGALVGYNIRSADARASSALRQDRAPISPAASKPVLVELFTSEGCSSCPPADALLNRLSHKAAVDGVQIIPLAEHVDYWNHLGWADPFSNPHYTARQRSYAQLFHLDQVYTPQMVVNGQRELLGSDESAARSAIAASKQSAMVAANITVPAPGTLHSDVLLNVEVGPIGAPQDGETTDIVVAITEDNLQSNVTRGENQGRRLPHTGVVRHWATIGHANRETAFTRSVDIKLENAWKRSDLRAVLIVQGHDTGRIYGLATVPFR